MQGRQPERLPALVQHQFGGRSRRHLPDRRPARRADHARQGLVLRGRWPVGVARQPARRVLQQRCKASGIQRRATLFYPGQPGTPYANASYDTSRPAAGFDWYRTHSLRMTWQVSERHRIGWFGDIQKSCRCTTGPFTGANAIESERGWDWWPAGVVQGTWTAPLTNRLLLEAGLSWQTTNWVNFAETGVTRDDRSILEAIDQLPIWRGAVPDGADCPHGPQRPSGSRFRTSPAATTSRWASPTSRASTTSRAAQSTLTASTGPSTAAARSGSTTLRCRSISRNARTTRSGFSRRTPGPLAASR